MIGDLTPGVILNAVEVTAKEDMRLQMHVFSSINLLPQPST